MFITLLGSAAAWPFAARLRDIDLRQNLGVF
jgi:hypothetical protein